jgi:nucleotide-binding universal stress UspA family protein
MRATTEQPPYTTRIDGTTLPVGPSTRVVQSETRGAILLATDGRPASVDAVRFAVALAEARLLPLQILGVVEPLPMSLDEDAALIALVDVAQFRKDKRHVEVREQLQAVLGADLPLGINIEPGRAAPTIVRRARDWGAGLIVLGIGHCHAGGRIIGAETALRVAMRAPAPTLAVASGYGSLPRSIVVAVDFGASSVNAARQAALVAADGAEVYLVHVVPALEFAKTHRAQWARVYAEGVTALLDEIELQLRAVQDRLTIHTILSEGSAAPRILEIAAQTGAELIAAGRHGPSVFGRLWIGSVSSTLLREASCSVLVAPAES